MLTFIIKWQHFVKHFLFDLDGEHSLLLTDVQWKAMQSTAAFKGLNVKVTKGPGGKLIIVMDRTQWQQMQVNMRLVYTQTIMQQINVQQVAGIRECRMKSQVCENEFTTLEWSMNF